MSTRRAGPCSIGVRAGSAEPFDGGRAAWNPTLPTSELRDLTFAVFAADARIDLPDARVGRLDLTVNAAKTVVDLTDAEVAELDAVVNVGQLVITLPEGNDLSGSLKIGAGDPEICVPARSRAARDGEQHRRARGRARRRRRRLSPLSPNYRSATHRADLTVSTTFGAVDIDPIGGCE